MSGLILRWLLAGCCLMGATPASAANQADIDGAFIAAFGGSPPITRNVMQPVGSKIVDGKRVPASAPRTFSLMPERLVSLGRSRSALIVSEVAQKAGHAWPGAIAIAYLGEDNGWRLEHVWPEIAFVGNFGTPSDKAEVKRFGGQIIYLATSRYCGMGGCEDTVFVITLDQTAPRFVGSVAGDSVFPVFPDPDRVTRCETYKYSVKIGPPVTGRGLMSVTYKGWTAPANRTAPKHYFRLQADAVVTGDHLELQPKISIPDCGK